MKIDNPLHDLKTGFLHDPEPPFYRLTSCCGAYSTFHDSTLCCKHCWDEVETGEGDGTEKLPSLALTVTDD